MAQHISAHIIKHNTPPTSHEIEHIQEDMVLSPQELELAIIREWNALQQVPSYVEGLMAANRGLIEGIATQS